MVLLSPVPCVCLFSAPSSTRLRIRQADARVYRLASPSFGVSSFADVARLWQPGVPAKLLARKVSRDRARFSPFRIMRVGTCARSSRSSRIGGIFRVSRISLSRARSRSRLSRLGYWIVARSYRLHRLLIIDTRARTGNHARDASLLRARALSCLLLLLLRLPSSTLETNICPLTARLR